MTTHRRAVRPWTLVLVVALLATMLVALRPSGTTMAAWSDVADVEMPALTTGGIGLTVTPVTDTSAGITLTGDAEVSWRPVSVTVLAGDRPLAGTGLVGSMIEYRLAGTDGRCPTSGAASYTADFSGAGTTVPVSGTGHVGGERTLCLTFAPSEQLRASHPAGSVTVLTTIEGAAEPSGWVTSADWTSTHELGAAAQGAALTCTPARGNRVTLGWAGWQALTPDPGQWVLQVHRAGQWTDHATSPEVGPGSLTFQNSDFASWSGVHEVRLAARLPGGATLTSATAAIDISSGLSCA